MSVEHLSFSSEAWEGPATWAQQARWDMISRQDTTGWNRNGVAVWPVPDGNSVSDVLAGIERAVAHYDGLRTQVVAGKDGPVQRTYGTGEYPVEIVEAGHRHDHVAEEVGLRLRAVDRFEPGRLPFAFAVITIDGLPRSLVICLSHLAMDASTIRLFRPGQVMAGATTPIPIPDFVALQTSAGYHRRSERSVAFWRGELAKVKMPFTERLDGAGGIVQGGLSSAAAATRLDELSELSGLNSSAIVLGMVAVALESVNRHGTLCLQLEMSNRHLPGLDAFLGVLAQLTPLVVEVDQSLSFGDIVRLVQDKSMKAFRNALWSPAELYSGLRADGLEPDSVLGATYTFNDVRGPWPQIPLHPPDPGRDYAFIDFPGWPYQLGRCAIAIAGGQHTLNMAARVDTAYLPAGTLPRILVALDAVLRRAHERGPEVSVGELIEAAGPVRTTSVRKGIS